MTSVLVELVPAYAGNYVCRVGCGRSFLTEAARDVHEETCNGGVDLTPGEPIGLASSGSRGTVHT